MKTEPINKELADKYLELERAKNRMEEMRFIERLSQSNVTSTETLLKQQRTSLATSKQYLIKSEEAFKQLERECEAMRLKEIFCNKCGRDKGLVEDCKLATCQ